MLLSFVGLLAKPIVERVHIELTPFSINISASTALILGSIAALRYCKYQSTTIGHWAQKHWAVFLTEEYI